MRTTLERGALETGRGGILPYPRPRPGRRLLFPAFQRRGLFLLLTLAPVSFLLSPLNFSCASLSANKKSVNALPLDTTIMADTILADSSFSIPKHGVLAPGIGGIMGKVTDSKTHEGLAGCEVRLTFGERELYTASDIDGTFSIINIPPGPYTITCLLLGYKRAVIQKAVILPDQFRRINFKLKLQPNYPVPKPIE